MNKPDKLPLRTPDLTERNYATLAALFPNAVTESIDESGVIVRAVDADVLRQEINTHVVSGKEERYQFTWPDKKKAVLLANAPIAATLRPCREESVDFDSTENLYIEGDNLDVLKLLRETYLNRVKMIYIDPPYNTGNDFVYQDDFAEDAGEFLARDSQYDEDGNRMVRNLDSNGRFHTDWLNMIYPRLRVARDLLTDDGVVFISVDDNEVENLKKICNEIFGEENFITQISYINNPKGRSHDMYFATCHEYLLIYAKYSLPKGSFSVSKEEDELKSNYTLHDDNGTYRLLELRNSHREFGRHNRPNLYYPFYVDKRGQIQVVPTSEQTEEIYPIWNDGYEGCWTWGAQKALSEIDLLIAKKVDGAWKIYRKSYAIQDGVVSKKQLKSLWTDSEYFTERGQKTFNELFESKEKIFQSPKSVGLIKQLLQTCTSALDSDITLDFFSGSATTAHAVMQLNAEDGGKRKFIMVQLPEKCDEGSEAAKAGYKNICEIGKERIRRAGAKIVASGEGRVASGQQSLITNHSSLDTGFRVLKLDSSNMKDVYYTPQDMVSAGGVFQRNLDDLIDNIKPDRTAEDLLFQVMLDLGIPLSAKIEKRVFSGEWLVASEKTIQGQTVFFVNPAHSDNSPLATGHSPLTTNNSSLSSSHYLIACFDRATDEIVTEIAKSKPYYAVFRDSSFASDATLTNFEQIFKTYSPTTKRRVL